MSVVLETIPDRVNRYILDGGDADLRRLLRIAQLVEDMARRAFQRVGVQDGWHVVECGCGPIGALAVLAELVGPSGKVVGIDSSAPAVQRARSVVATLGLDNVHVVGDVHDVNVAMLGGPFDLAYTRLFLMHQSDPVGTLQQIGGLVRPGGWIVAQEPLRIPAPRSNPHLDALDTYWELVHQLTERAGVPPRAVDDLPRAARAAGLEVVSLEGFFGVMEAGPGFEVHAATAAAARGRAVETGVATEGEVDELVGSMRRAMDGEYDWVSSPFFLDLAFRKPVEAEVHRRPAAKA
jgi:SAM-dependent methyltransferase